MRWIVLFVEEIASRETYVNNTVFKHPRAFNSIMLSVEKVRHHEKGGSVIHLKQILNLIVIHTQKYVCKLLDIFILLDIYQYIRPITASQ